MNEKRFTYLDASRNKYIGSFFCNGIPLTNSEVVDFLNETEQLRDMGNNLEKKIHIYETTLKESIQNERTHLGHNALKQLAENLGVEL